jgi:tripartite-type tricarboxylate transporter receptor subunit TctC
MANEAVGAKDGCAQVDAATAAPANTWRGGACPGQGQGHGLVRLLIPAGWCICVRVCVRTCVRVRVPALVLEPTVSLAPALALARALALALGLAFAASPAFAQAPYPQRPIRLICPTAPGSSPDTLARLMAQHLSLQLGQAVLVENQPGAGTTRGTAAVAAATPDGYTLLATFSPTFSMSALRYKSARYTAQQSFTPVGSFGSITPFLVVHTGVPARNLADYVALAKQTPQRLEFATSGAAGMPLLLGQSLAQAAGIELLFVPYASEAESRQDVISGRVSTAVFWAPVTLQLSRAGKVRALAYAGSQRHPDLPDVPTFAEQGFASLEFQLQMLLLGPAGLPNEVTQRLNTALARAMGTPELRAQLRSIGIEASFGDAAYTAALIAQDTLRHGPWAAKAANQAD